MGDNASGMIQPVHEASHRPSPTPRVCYDGVIIGLHWLLALLITASFGQGLYMIDLPVSPLRLKLYNWHKWAGVSILALSAVRVFWRWRHPTPALPGDVAGAMPPWQHTLLHATHRAMYLLFFIVPLAGWAYSSAAGFPVAWFGVLLLPDFMPVSRELAEDVLRPLHAGSAFALAGLVVLHLAAVLKHQWIDGADMLGRMWPARRKGQP